MLYVRFRLDNRIERNKPLRGTSGFDRAAVVVKPGPCLQAAGSSNDARNMMPASLARLPFRLGLTIATSRLA